MKLTSVLFNSKVDTFYRSILLSKFFIKGWGSTENLKDIFKFRKHLSNRETCQTLVNPDHTVYIDKCVEKTNDYNLYEGHFRSPLVDYLPVHEACKIAKFQLIEPTKEKLKKIKLDNKIRPVVVHLAGTGDHFYWRRRNFLAKPLLDYGITSVILENPYYGSRKPANQFGSCLLRVQDIFIMGGCLVLENIVLFNYLERNGFGPLGVTGVSLGGHMSSLAGCSWPKPISIIPCLSWTTASCVWTQGILSGAVPWEVLKNQYKHFGIETISELSKLIHSPERNDLFDAGRQFAKQFPVKKNEDNQLNNEKNLLNNESYIEKLNTLNEEKRIKKLKETNDETGTKIENNDSFRSFLNSVSFNIYDSLNKTLVNSKKNNKEEDDSALKDAINFMVGIMDECTHLKNFDLPLDSSLCIIVQAVHDGYVPRTNLIPLNELWLGSSLRTIDAGHVISILFYHRLFCEAIVDSLDLNARKYYNSKILEKSFLDREEESLIVKKSDLVN